MEAARPSTPFSTKPINMGTWNVRTVYQTGKVAHEAAEMTHYKLALLGISETRWTQAGQRRIPTGELLLLSGHEEDDASHTEGVPFMLSRAALIQWDLENWDQRLMS